MRGPGRFNIDLSVRRIFQIRERSMLEFAANATNLLNHTQFAANYDGALGSTNTAVNTTNGLKPGMAANGNTFGTLSLASTCQRLRPAASGHECPAAILITSGRLGQDVCGGRNPILVMGKIEWLK
jgi:hypothetical protein